jgi:hypothetical protein
MYYCVILACRSLCERFLGPYPSYPTVMGLKRLVEAYRRHYEGHGVCLLFIMTHLIIFIIDGFTTINTF